MSDNTLTHAAISATHTVPLDPATLKFYRDRAVEAQQIVDAALSLRDRMLAEDEKLGEWHPMGNEDAAFAVKVLSGSEYAWSVLSNGLMAVVYGEDR